MKRGDLMGCEWRYTVWFTTNLQIILTPDTIGNIRDKKHVLGLICCDHLIRIADLCEESFFLEAGLQVQFFF